MRAAGVYFDKINYEGSSYNFRHLFSCSNSDKISDKSQEDSNEIGKIEKEDEISDNPEIIHPESKNKNEDWLHPKFLTADFNNDNIADTAFAVIIGEKKGIKIKHGGTNEEYVIGAGNKFGNGGDDFYWVDSWKIVNNSITYNQTFADNGDVAGTEEVKLESTAFYIEKDEVGGATIAWIDGEYVWIHQAD